jgi:hypothetical protein
MPADVARKPRGDSSAAGLSGAVPEDPEGKLPELSSEHQPFVRWSDARRRTPLIGERHSVPSK